MTDGEFAAGDWTERLSCALSALAGMQARYRDELDERRRQRIDTERRIGRPIGGDRASDDLWAFYSRASFAEGRYFEQHYGPGWQRLRNHRFGNGTMLVAPPTGSVRIFRKAGALSPRAVLVRTWTS